MDLTSHFLASRTLSEKLSQQQYLASLLKTGKDEGFILDWDVEDGERMGRFFYKNRLVAVFYTYLPLIFAIATARQALTAGYDKSGKDCPVLVEIPDFENQYFSVNEEVKNFTDWNSDAVNSENFSINDLYYTGV